MSTVKGHVQRNEIILNEFEEMWVKLEKEKAEIASQQMGILREETKLAGEVHKGKKKKTAKKGKK
jgi:hypothetical protein